AGWFIWQKRGEFFGGLFTMIKFGESALRKIKDMAVNGQNSVTRGLVMPNSGLRAHGSAVSRLIVNS
ncbi:MAG: hypothetical protein WBN68_18955, partial [Sedimenticolaceae bacterium]